MLLSFDCVNSPQGYIPWKLSQEEDSIDPESLTVTIIVFVKRMELSRYFIIRKQGIILWMYRVTLKTMIVGSD